MQGSSAEHPADMHAADARNTEHSSDETADDLVTSAFRQMDFVPHVYDDALVQRRYGGGSLTRNEGVCTRTYTDAAGVSVSFSGECERPPEFRIVEEMRVVRVQATASNNTYPGRLEDLSLFGIRLGSSRKDALALVHRKSGAHDASVIISGKQYASVMFYPPGENANLLYFRYILMLRNWSACPSA